VITALHYTEQKNQPDNFCLEQWRSLGHPSWKTQYSL